MRRWSGASRPPYKRFMRVGFAGLGLMGRPMAANLLRAGMSLTVWNRSPEAAAALCALGADRARDPDALFAACDAVVLMLADDQAVDAVLGRGSEAFRRRVAGRLVVNMGTHAPAYSQLLEREVLACGGEFVEAPVSGSRIPAETGQLVAMLAGRAESVVRARHLVAPMCRTVSEVGAVPSGMLMKLAVNAYLISSVAALAEAAQLADRLGLHMESFREVILSGPLRSAVAESKLDKMTRRDFSPQAAIRDVCKNARLVSAAAGAVRAACPLLDRSARCFESVLQGGGGELDMAAVITAFEPEGASA